MSVLLLRRDMVVADDSVAAKSGNADQEAVVAEPAAEPVSEIEAPFPLRTISREASLADGGRADLEDIEHEDLDRGPSFLSRLRGWFFILVFVAGLAAYPVLTVRASDVGDDQVAGLSDRTDWTAPWAGASSVLMERHFAELGWATDAPDWSPMARLSAKPALQQAMAEALGEYVTLMAEHARASEGEADPDLQAAARLININSSAVQLRAARDALVNYDRRLRRRGGEVDLGATNLPAQLSLVEGWASRSEAEVGRAAGQTAGGPLNVNAAMAVYQAKGRAQAAYMLIETMYWPEDAGAAAARSAALEAWEAAATFHPLVVLNGSPDGWLIGNHAAAMGFLLAQAKAATHAYVEALADAAPVAPTATPAPPPAPGAAVN
jgi:hypothetical protein